MKNKKAKKKILGMERGMFCIIFILLIILALAFILPFIFEPSCSLPCQKLNGECFCGKERCVEWEEGLSVSLIRNLTASDSELGMCDWVGYEQKLFCLKDKIWTHYTKKDLEEMGYNNKESYCKKYSSEQEPICLEWKEIGLRIFNNKDIRYVDEFCYEMHNPNSTANYIESWGRAYRSCLLQNLDAEKEDMVRGCKYKTTNLQELWDAGKCETLECVNGFELDYNIRGRCCKKTEDTTVKECAIEGTSKYSKTLKCGEMEWERK